MEELYAKFLPPFLEQARERLVLARAAAARPEGPELGSVIRDLHSLAGEAGLLGLITVVPAARAAEDAAKRLRDSPPGADAAAFAEAVEALARVIQEIGKPAAASP